MSIFKSAMKRRRQAHQDPDSPKEMSGAAMIFMGLMFVSIMAFTVYVELLPHVSRSTSLEFSLRPSLE